MKLFNENSMMKIRFSDYLEKVTNGLIFCYLKIKGKLTKCLKCLKSSEGQGTTEYAILVGVLVVIAILAITVFRPKIQELWDAISSGINGL